MLYSQFFTFLPSATKYFVPNPVCFSSLSFEVLNDVTDPVLRRGQEVLGAVAFLEMGSSRRGTNLRSLGDGYDQ
jgi:hypothetical protein